MTVNEYQTYSLLNNSDRSPPEARALRLRLARGIQGVVAAALPFLRGSIGALATDQIIDKNITFKFFHFFLGGVRYLHLPTTDPPPRPKIFLDF